mmetsp:Transcript_17363/g.31995  ORF Transcript_17363/g.31995 Transcript_17363/m.31995 type:complete len:438 (+) Transcript_17363:42-1355(+)
MSVTMKKVALLWACMACVGLGRRSLVAELQRSLTSADAHPSLHSLAEAHGSAKRTSTSRALAMLLVGRNPAAAFNPSMSGTGKTARAARRAVSPEMKWDVSLAPWALEYGRQAPPVDLPQGVSEGQAAPPFQITEEHRQRLEEDGVVHIKGLLTPQWIEYLRDATDWQVDNPHFYSTVGVASGLYDYIQRSIWACNDAYANFLYYSPLASALAGLSGAKELRLATDLLMVNPNKGFKWHQDNQNGPIDAFKDGVALRWWCTMDDCPPDHGAPVYLKGSHRNTQVSKDAVFVDLEKDGLLDYPELIEFRPKAGDLIVWHPKAIHKIDGPKTQDWEARKRRVYGGTVVVDDATYVEGGAQFSDMGSHTLKEGDLLHHPLFPKIYPVSEAEERRTRASGKCMRTVEGFGRLAGNMASSIGEMASWTKVLNADKNKEKARR